MMEYPETQGKTTIDPRVLIKICKLTSLEVPGVSRMDTGPHSVDDVLKKNYADGVKISVQNNTVFVDLYLVLDHDTDLYKTSQLIQKKVSRAITELVGMDIGKVNIHVEDINYQK